jgi:hypothetical protein
VTLLGARLHFPSDNVFIRSNVRFTASRTHGGAFVLLLTLLTQETALVQPFDDSLLDLIPTSNSEEFDVEIKFDIGRHQTCGVW